MTQRPQAPAEVPSDVPVSPGRAVRVLALAAAVLAVVFALLGFLGAAVASGLPGALVLGGGLLAGAAALPRAGRVTVPAAVVATVGTVGALQVVAASDGGGGLPAAAVAVLMWVTAVAAALLDAGVFGARAPRPAVAPPAPAPPAPAWAPVPGWPSADPTMTYVGQQPTGQQAFGAAQEDRTVVGRAPGGAFAGAPEPAAVFGSSAQAGGPEPTAVFGRAAQAGGPEPTAVIAGLSPQVGAPEAPAAGPPRYGLSGGQPPTGTHTAPTPDGAQRFAAQPAADPPLFAGQGPVAAAGPTATGAAAAGRPPTGAPVHPDVSLFGAPGFAQARPTPEAPSFDLAGTGQAASSAHHEPVQDASAFDRSPGGEVPLFGVSGLGQTASMRPEPVQDTAAHDRAQPGPVHGAERGQTGAGAHRAPIQDGAAPPFGAQAAGRPGRNGSPLTGGHPGSTPTYGVSGGPARSDRGSNADPHGLFTAGPAPSGAHLAPTEGGSPTKGRPGPGRTPTSEAEAAPSYGTNGSAVGEPSSHGTSGAARDGSVPSQRAGTEASGPSHQQAAGDARRRGGEGSPFGRAGAGAGAEAGAAQPTYGRPASTGREAPVAGRRSAEQRPAEPGGDSADPTPETTAFPVQHGPTADPAPQWGQPPSAGQDATMIAAPGWLVDGQPEPDTTAGPPGPRRAARHGVPSEGRHGTPER